MDEAVDERYQKFARLCEEEQAAILEIARLSQEDRTAILAIARERRKRGTGSDELWVHEGFEQHAANARRCKQKVEARERAEKFLAALLRDDELEPIPDSDGMFVLRDIPSFETGETGPIVVRKMTDAFWQSCIDIVDTPGMRYRVAAVGTSGAGKTASTPLLIRKLLRRDGDVSVVYRVLTLDKDGFYYEFIRQGRDVSVDVHEEECPPESLDSRSTYYIVDPGRTKTVDCTPDDLFNPRSSWFLPPIPTTEADSELATRIEAVFQASSGSIQYGHLRS
jgi:hypothetical protein